MGENRIGDSGAASLSQAFAINSSVTNLDLSESDIADSVAAELSCVCKVDTTTKRLW